MWGCIAGDLPEIAAEMVPSLYVRVYRDVSRDLGHSSGSLIICEGVSDKSIFYPCKWAFLHYMWGYINTRPRQCGAILGSLIICEGISINHPKTHLIEGFPHYMWGYIKPGRLFVCSRTVPSLYVRVYRVTACGHLSQTRSLIIREGISKSAMASFRHQKI